MIDDGELDWKVIAISTSDPLASDLNDIDDVSAKCPGVIDGIREWFRRYKTPDGMPLNAFGFKEEAFDKAQAIAVLDETHQHWKTLRNGSSKTTQLWMHVVGDGV